MNNNKKFVKSSVVFVLAFLILLFLIDILYIGLVLPQKHFYKSEAQFRQNSDDGLKILFAGDSHPSWAVNPQYIKNSFNYAVPTETYEQTYYKMRKVLNEKNSIEVLALPYDLHSFANYQSNPWSEVRYWSEFMDADELGKSSNKSIASVYLYKYFPFLGKGNDFRIILFPGEKSTVISGWQQREEVLTDAKKDAKQKAELQFRNYPGIIDEKLLDFFLRALDLAEGKHKKVILIKYPITNEYKAALEAKGIKRGEFYSDLNKKISKYGYVQVLDYQDLFDNNSLFSDSNHLNKNGAEIFSKRLNEDLRDSIID